MFTSAAGQGRGLSYSCKHIQCDRRASTRVVELDAEVLSRVFAFMASVAGQTQEFFAQRADSAPPVDADLAEAQQALDDAEYLLAKFDKREASISPGDEPRRVCD